MFDFLFDLYCLNGVDVWMGVVFVLFDLWLDDVLKVCVMFVDGMMIDVDFVVVGIGFVFNVLFVSDVGFVVDDGIVVDEYGVMSDLVIFVCGDVVNYYNGWLKWCVWFELWVNV